MTGTSADNREDDELRRLEDIRPEEVSTVDRAANRRKFLVVKRDGDSGDGALQSDGNGGFKTPDGEGAPAAKLEGLKMPGAVRSQVANAITESLERLAKVVTTVKDADEGGEQALPQALTKEISAVQAIVDGVTRRFATAAEEQKDEGDSGEGEGGGEGTQKIALPAAVKTAILERLSGVMERLMAVATQVKDSEDAEDSDRPLPAELGRELTTIAAMIGSVTEKYPSPTSSADAAPDDGKADDADEAKAKAEAQAKAASQGEVLKLLGALKALLAKTDFPVPAAAAPAAAAPAAKRDDPAPTTPAKPDPRVEETLARVAGMLDELKGLTKVVKSQGARLKRIANARGLANGIPVDKNDGGAPEPADEWPADLNDEPKPQAA